MDNDINYVIKGVGLPVVFQHGLTANINQTQALLLGIPGIQLISIDCPGHGASKPEPNFKPGFNSYADTLIRCLDRFDIEQAVFGGISMGSGIALNIAMRYPQRVKGLILVRPAWLDQPFPANLQILLPAAELMNQQGGREAFCKLEQFQQVKPAAAAKSILGIFSDDQQPELASVIPLLVGDYPVASLARLDSIDQPAVIIGNDHDPLHPYAIAEKIHQYMPASVLQKVTSRYIDDELHSNQVREIIQNFIKENNL